MKKLLLLLPLMLTLTACGTTAVVGPSRPNAGRTVRARVTFYDKHEDRFGSRIAMTNSLRAKEGVTLAAPSALPFRTKVTIPALKGHVGDGEFEIQDRGSALERAYRRGQLRLDVYVLSRRKHRWLGGAMPEYMDAFIAAGDSAAARQGSACLAESSR